MANDRTQGGGLDAKSQEAFDAAFKAMADWRDELRAVTELHGGRTFDRLAAAARAAGWPDAVIDATKTQLLQASRMQGDMLDHMMRAWQEQLKSPGRPSDLMSTITQQMSSMMPPQTPQMSDLAMAPAQFWMQATAMWQKSFSDAMATWTGGKPGGGDKR